MDSESKALRWVANLRNQFTALRSEADVIVPQEPIEFVRNQFLAVGESLKKFCAELLEDSRGCLEEINLTLRPKENGDCIGMVEAEALEPSKTTEGVQSDAEEHVAPKACKISDDELTSCGFSKGEDAKDSCVSEPSEGIWLTQNPTGWQKLGGSDDEFCTDFNVDLNLLSYSKANNHLRRTASFKERDEDLCGSDWEII